MYRRSKMHIHQKKKIAESHSFSIISLRTQETLRNHMRHLARHKTHHLANISERCFYNRIAQVIVDHKHVLPTSFQCHKLLDIPPWTLPQIKIYGTIPGIDKKSVLPAVVLRQLSLSYIHYEHRSTCHIYTDASTTFNQSSIGIVIPAFSLKIGRKLSHRMPSTAAELVAIREALRYIQEIPPRSSTIVTDSRSSLQSLQFQGVKSPNRQLLLDILKLHWDAIRNGHSVCLQCQMSHMPWRHSVCLQVIAASQ